MKKIIKPLTPQREAKKLASAFATDIKLYLKREDLHPYGSHKGRSIPHMIETYVQNGITNFCISSSGNAALAAALYIKKYNTKHKSSRLTLTIFLGKNINKEKLAILENLDETTIHIEKTDNPKQSAFKMDKASLAKNLRQSTDDTALVGYADLAHELSTIKNLQAIFIPTSSGTTAEGLYKSFTHMGLKPQIHVVQTTSCHPIAQAFAPTITQLQSPTETSLAGAIVDKIVFRKNNVLQAVKKSKGNTWICTNAEIKQAIKIIKKTENIDISANSALSVAALSQAIKNNWDCTGAAVCLITGR
ncbi:MAG: PLP-dependent lyase/thiolase [Candidatus Magasanikbacteria bacterium]|nr:PLP-dependent lyase/thiolase [Candidatus Magasanikbacteria bacterium]